MKKCVILDMKVPNIFNECGSPLSCLSDLSCFNTVSKSSSSEPMLPSSLLVWAFDTFVLCVSFPLSCIANLSVSLLIEGVFLGEVFGWVLCVGYFWPFFSFFWSFLELFEEIVHLLYVNLGGFFFIKNLE